MSQERARSFHTFVGIDLGGARGKSTAVAHLTCDAVRACRVEAILTRTPDGRPWTDESLLEWLDERSNDGVVLAVAGPLTLPACLRCTAHTCPGYDLCEDPATQWLRSEGEALQERAALADRDRIAAIPSHVGFTSSRPEASVARRRLAPYTHRCTDVHHHFDRDLVPREHLVRGAGPIASRGVHLRRQLAHRGYQRDHSLLEVSPRATIQVYFGSEAARGYKRDADPWRTRARILDDLSDDLSFAPRSRLAKEEVLQSDHAFDALIAGYTAHRWSLEGWSRPSGPPWDDDGWLWTPPEG